MRLRVEKVTRPSGKRVPGRLAVTIVQSSLWEKALGWWKGRRFDAQLDGHQWYNPTTHKDLPRFVVRALSRARREGGV